MNFKSFALVASAAFALSVGSQAQVVSAHLSKVGPAYSSTSVNTAVFRNSPLVTADSAGVKYQFVSYYSPDGMLTVARRVHGSDNWTICKTSYRANVEDGHNVVSMGIDGNGFLHVAYDHHGHKLHYRRSVSPFSPVLTDEVDMIGQDEDKVTYPEFHSLPSGNLIFLYRSGVSGNGDMVMNAYDAKTKAWRRVQNNLIDGEGDRNAYWQLTTDAHGRIHVSWVWRETWKVESNHDMCYAYSDDEGATWRRSDGSAYTLPITIKNAEIAWVIPQKSELINQTSMACDMQGHPYIATYWRASDSKVPQYRMVWHDAQKWNMKKVSDRTLPFSLAGGGTKMIPISRPRLVIGKKTAYYIFRDTERGSKVSVYTCPRRKILKGKWQCSDLTDFSVGAWEPSYDETLLVSDGSIHLFVQSTVQGDGEKVKPNDPTDVYVLEIK